MDIKREGKPLKICSNTKFQVNSIVLLPIDVTDQSTDISDIHTHSRILLIHLKKGNLAFSDKVDESGDIM